MKWTIPNILTVFRLAAAPTVAIVFLVLARPYADWAALALFVLAAVTDWVDGYLARKLNQQSKIGTMLDPIADKAMVIIALTVLAGTSSLTYWLLLPSVLILFREVFVSGLREYLGDVAGTLKVTKLAKWKTTVQMFAIACLFAQGAFEHRVGMFVFGMDTQMVSDILSGVEEDVLGLRSAHTLMNAATYLGLILLWIAAGLTAITWWDYFKKALPHLDEDV